MPRTPPIPHRQTKLATLAANATTAVEFVRGEAPLFTMELYGLRGRIHEC